MRVSAAKEAALQPPSRCMERWAEEEEKGGSRRALERRQRKGEGRRLLKKNS